jgi:histidinol-phosphate phosphatase family protein
MIKQAVILAGGQGIRLRPLTFTTPKPLILIHGKPFVQYLVERLKENGIREIVFLNGYLGEQIEKYFGDGSKFGLKITYSYSPIEYNTGARIRDSKELFDDMFLLLYCDNYWPLNLKELTKFYKKVGTDAMVTVYANKDNYTNNNIRVNEKGIVEVYDKARRVKGLNGVDIGFFILKKSVLSNLPKENFSFEKVIVPRLIKKKQLAGFLTYHKYYGLSNLERIPLIEEYFKDRKLIFLDRDGVINKRPPKADYVKTLEEFRILPHALEALKLLTRKGFEIYIISNQAGIARGIMTEKDLQKIHNFFLEICKKNDIKIKDIYCCPHGWDEDCFCRKPQPGMLFQASYDHHFDLTKAIFIGDDIRDKKAANAAGSKTIIMPPDGNLLKIVKGFLQNQ